MLNNFLAKNKYLGISVYPEHSTTKEIKGYISKAHKLNYKRIFLSLLQINDSNKIEILEKYKEICTYAKNLGFSVILDVAPSVFDYLQIRHDNLVFFHDIGATVDVYKRQHITC